MKLNEYNSNVSTLYLLILQVSNHVNSETLSSLFGQQESDIQRKVVSTRIVSTPTFRSAHYRKSAAAHASSSVFLGSTLSKGEYKACRIGGVLV